jgi:hypothetical protein
VGREIGLLRWLRPFLGLLERRGFAEHVHHVDHSVDIGYQPDRERDEVVVPVLGGFDRAVRATTPLCTRSASRTSPARA